MNTEKDTALIFYYGARLAASLEFSIEDILTVFTMLLFSLANVNSVLSFSEYCSFAQAIGPYLTHFQSPKSTHLVIPQPDFSALPISPKGHPMSTPVACRSPTRSRSNLSRPTSTIPLAQTA